VGDARETSWVESATEALRRGGYQSGGARRAVLELIGDQECALTALEIEERLGKRKRRVARASIYRALRRIERQPGAPAGFERVEPSGHHHHHFVCDGCGKLVPFEDPGLERLMRRLESGSSFTVREHDVVLRGSCEACAA
jgi:Fur family ferric uptake transcriptional regulator